MVEKNWMTSLMIFSYVICTAISFAFLVLYAISGDFLRNILGKISHDRFTMGFIALIKYPVTFWGINIPEIGSAGILDEISSMVQFQNFDSTDSFWAVIILTVLIVLFFLLKKRAPVWMYPTTVMIAALTGIVLTCILNPQLKIHKIILDSLTAEEIQEIFSKYFFIDASYVKVLLENGFLMFSLSLFWTTGIQYRLMKHQQLFAMSLMTIIALQCMMEHHLLDMAYNVFLLMLFADLKPDPKKEFEVLDASGTWTSSPKHVKL